MAGVQARKGAKGRKIGRNKAFCERYKAEGRRLRNKIRRLKAHLRRFPQDTQAANRLHAL